MALVAGSKGQEKYKTRQTTIEKKAAELAILCGVPVCVIIKDIHGRISTVPQDRGEVVDIILTYKRKKQADLVVSDKKTNVVIKHETWDPSFNYLPEEKSVEFMKELEDESKMVDEAIRRQEEVISKKRKGKRILVGDGLTKVGNKKAKGIVLDSTVTNSVSSDSFGVHTGNNTDFSDGVSIRKKLTEDEFAGEIDNDTDVEALHASTMRPVKLFGIFLN